MGLKSHLIIKTNEVNSCLFFKPVSQRLGYAPPVTLTTSGSVLPVPGRAIMSLFQEVVYRHLAIDDDLATTSLFQEGLTW